MADAGPGATAPEAGTSAFQGRADASAAEAPAFELADSSGAGNALEVDAFTDAAASSSTSKPQGAGAKTPTGNGEDFLSDEMELSEHGLEQQLQQLALQKPGEANCCCLL